MLVNKYYYLEADYEPELVLLDQSYGAPEVYLESETFTHFDMLFQAALASGIQLYITSGYRGYAPQEEVFLDYLSRMSEEEALTYAAKPGFSEHQTGFALDVLFLEKLPKLSKTLSLQAGSLSMLTDLGLYCAIRQVKKTLLAIVTKHGIFVMLDVKQRTIFTKTA